MLWVKNCRNLSEEKYFPITKNIFSMPKNLELLFLRSLSLQVIGYIIINIFLYSYIKSNVCSMKTERESNTVKQTLFFFNLLCIAIAVLMFYRVPRGSVVKCLTRNPGVLGSSRTGSSGFFRGIVLGQDTSEPSLVLVKPRKA